MARSWYAYRPDLGTNKSDPGNYRAIAHNLVGTETCFTGPEICAIYAPSGDVTPDAPFSANLLFYINSSTSSSVPLPTGAGVRKYIYKRDEF